MANIASAEKKNRQRLRRRARNLHHLTTMRTLVKRVRAAVESKDGKTAQTALFEAVRIIDRAAQRGAIDKKAASRKKSRLTLAVNGLGA